MKQGLICLAAAVVFAAGCASVRNPVSGQQELTVMDEKSELAEGRKGHQDVLKTYPVVADPALRAYVDGVGRKLAALSHRKELEWHFTVLDSPEVNAFALPGGYIYITRGIMAYLDSEADLAGVIGHEIGHVTARHGAQRATRQQTAGFGVLAAAILGAVLEGSGVRGAGDLASGISQGVAAGWIAAYGREQELQADGLGAEYLARTGYDPKNMVEVIGVLKDQESHAADVARAAGRKPSSRGDWLASHPSNDKRLEDIRRIATGYHGNYSDAGRARYLKAIDGIGFGDSREQGVSRGRNFYHQPLGFALTAPEGWRIDNDAEALTLLSAAGDAGLIVKLLPPEAGSSHDEIIRKLVQPIQGRSERLSIGGFAATHFNGTRKNRQGQVQGVEATFVSGPGQRQFVLLYAAKDARALQASRAKLREAENSFRALSAADQAAAKPWVIRTTAYPRGGFAELARQSPLGSGAEKQLRLLNGYYAGGEPKPGTTVKVVE